MLQDSLNISLNRAADYFLPIRKRVAGDFIDLTNANIVLHVDGHFSILATIDPDDETRLYVHFTEAHAAQLPSGSSNFVIIDSDGEIQTALHSGRINAKGFAI